MEGTSGAAEAKQGKKISRLEAGGRIAIWPRMQRVGEIVLAVLKPDKEVVDAIPGMVADNRRFERRMHVGHWYSLTRDGRDVFDPSCSI